MSLTFDPLQPAAFTRRAFISRGLVLASAAASIPTFIHASASAMTDAMGELSSVPGVPDEHILVVIQLSGGNDGLNTVVPYGLAEYYKARPAIGVPEKDVLKLGGNTSVGLHPKLGAIRELYDNGMAAVVQGVGYPNPNRSHFKSMDIWQTANPAARGEGWLGRYVDSECCGFGKGESGTADGTRTDAATDASANAPSGGPPGVAIGRTAPLAMQGQLIKPVSFESADLFRWTGRDIHESLRDPYDQLNRRSGSDAAKPGSNADFLLRTALDAQVSSDLIRKAVSEKSLVTYPGAALSKQLEMVAKMIRAGLQTRVYYVQHSGFDTHAGQGGANGRHAQLLEQFGQAVGAFYKDLKAQGNDGRVLTMSFSEFGRRVGQNASGGTDHGTAAPMFLFGPMVKAGVHSEHPSMTDLDEGDLKFNTDFRTVYSAVLEKWLKADSAKILEGRFRAADVIKTA